MRSTHEALFHLSAVFGSAILAEGTNANTFKTTAAVKYAINGVAYDKAATDNLTFSSGHTSLAALQVCLFLVQINAAGTVSTKQSNIETKADLAAGSRVLSIPFPDADNVALGYIRVQCDNSAVFVPNTTDLGATDVVDTYVNFAGAGPARPVS